MRNFVGKKFNESIITLCVKYLLKWLFTQESIIKIFSHSSKLKKGENIYEYFFVSTWS